MGINGILKLSTRQLSRLSFKVPHRVGALESTLSMIKTHNISLSSIESRPSSNSEAYSIFVEFEASNKMVEDVVKAINESGSQVQVLTTAENRAIKSSIPWFPRKIQDLDAFATRVMSYGAVS